MTDMELLERRAKEVIERQIEFIDTEINLIVRKVINIFWQEIEDEIAKDLAKKLKAELKDKVIKAVEDHLKYK